MSTQRFNFNPDIIDPNSSGQDVFFKIGLMPKVKVHIWGHEFVSIAHGLRYCSAKCGGTQLFLHEKPENLKDILPTMLMVPEEVEFLEYRPVNS